MTAKRVEGPTPNGGAYAILYMDAHDRSIEIVEYDAEGRDLMRTYVAQSDAGGDEEFRPEESRGIRREE